MSGDTAVPLPDPATDAVPDDGSMLTVDQRRRVEALQVARQILENKPGLFAGSKVAANRAVYDLTYLGDWIIDGPDNDDTVEIKTFGGETVAVVPMNPETARDASNAAYFNSGWDAVVREVRAVAAQQGAEAAVEWARTHPAGGRLIDGPDTLEADWDAPAVSTSEKPGEWVASEVDTFKYPTQERFDDPDAAATADLRAARSDADDGN